MFEGLAKTVFPHPALPTSMTGCLLLTSRSKKNLILIVSKKENWNYSLLFYFLMDRKAKHLCLRPFITWCMYKNRLQWNIWIKFKFWHLLNPWNKVLLVIVNIKIKDTAILGEIDGLELIHEPFWKFLKNKMQKSLDVIILKDAHHYQLGGQLFHHDTEKTHRPRYRQKQSKFHTLLLERQMICFLALWGFQAVSTMLRYEQCPESV